MLKNKFLYTVAAIAALVLFTAAGTPPAIAHHGWSEYNSERVLNLTGEIQTIGYSSPHVVVQLQTADRLWLAVLAPPTRLQSRGLPQTALEVGQTVSLVGYPHRAEPNEMRAERITVGEQTVELR
ncbi:hypothetical protein IFO70_22450 [Phormidium tenue FACHB-886]|nr:hypothetical protein [Phormidium tenue FACHB-886]